MRSIAAAKREGIALSAWRYLEEISRFPHRGATTREEKEAAGYLARALSNLGYQVQMQEFKAPRDTLYSGPPIIFTVFLALGAIALAYPGPSLIAMILILIPMIGDMHGGRPNFDLFLPKYPSQNVVGTLGGPGQHRQTLVISAHYDTQKGSPLFSPGFAPFVQPFFAVIYAGLVGILLSVVFRLVFSGTSWPKTVYLISGVIVAAGMIFLLVCKAVGRHVNGANDNGSGTALALALAERFRAEPPEGTRLIIALTGSEEVGVRGMIRFMDEYGPRLEPETASFINLDNLGGGKLRYLLNEGMIKNYRNDPDLVALAKSMATVLPPGRLTPQGRLLMYTDGIIPSRRGYKVITFISLNEKGRIPDYHWHSDCIENVDKELLEFEEGFIWAYFQAVVARDPSVRTSSL